MQYTIAAHLPSCITSWPPFRSIGCNALPIVHEDITNDTDIRVYILATGVFATLASTALYLFSGGAAPFGIAALLCGAGTLLVAADFIAPNDIAPEFAYNPPRQRRREPNRSFFNPSNTSMFVPRSTIPEESVRVGNPVSVIQPVRNLNPFLSTPPAPEERVRVGDHSSIVQRVANLNPIVRNTNSIVQWNAPNNTQPPLGERRIVVGDHDTNQNVQDDGEKRVPVGKKK